MDPLLPGSWHTTAFPCWLGGLCLGCRQALGLTTRRAPSPRPPLRVQKCAQVLLTLDNLANRSQYINAKNTFEELLR